MSKTNNKRSAEELDGQVDYKKLYEEEQQKIEELRAEYQELRQARKKKSVMHYADLKDGDIKLELDGGTKSSKVYPENHDAAKCTIKSGLWSTKCTASNIMSTLGEEVAVGIASLLFAGKCDDRSKELVFKYANETMVRTIVHYFLVDAVKTCNKLILKAAEGSEKLVPPQLEYGYECSMFKERPDHLIVYDTHSRAPLVTVEIKKPPVNSGLHEYPNLCGQGFDYLMATKMTTGNVCPMHITTTVDESYVAWLPENDDTVRKLNTNQQTVLVGVLSEIIDKASRRSGGDNREGEKDETPPVSTTFIEKEVERKICSSEIFPSNDLCFMMVNTILCAMYSSSSRGNSVIPLDIGVSVSQLALRLSEESFKWVEIDGIIVNGSIKEEPSLTTTAIYVVGVVGFGATSKAFRVITEDGYEGVLKMYVKETDVDDITVLSKEEYQSNAKESVKRELTIFNETYQDMPVFKVKLADHYGLLMPFFKPLDHKLDQVDKCSIIGALEKSRMEHLRMFITGTKMSVGGTLESIIMKSWHLISTTWTKPPSTRTRETKRFRNNVRIFSSVLYQQSKRLVHNLSRVQELLSYLLFIL